MKKIAILLLMFSALCQAQTADWGEAQWIWQQADGPSNTWMSFRKTVNIDDVPEQVEALLAVDSKFWLWINGEMVVFEGGTGRGPSPDNTWYEKVNIQPFLNEGKNTVALLVHYWGKNGGKGIHISSGKGGLLFQAEVGNISIISDKTWKMKVHSSYNSESGGGTHRLPSYNVWFDGNASLEDWTSAGWHTANYDDSGWENAIEKGTPPSAPWGNLELNYVGNFKNYGLENYTNFPATSFPFTTTKTDTIICKLPFNKQITAYLEVDCDIDAAEIKIGTDNYLNSIESKYICRKGKQKFEGYSWMSGHEVHYIIPAGVKVNDLKYRWTGVGEMKGDFECSDAFSERLWWMGRNTLYICARDNYMDCPDRERALWIGDVADQANYLFYVLDEPGRLLMKKAIRTTMLFSKSNGIFGSQGPGKVRELPAQSLQFICQGIWEYYFNTGDTATLEFAYPYIHKYLALWQMDSDGGVVTRVGGRDWYDWGPHIDGKPMHSAWYYMALKAAKKTAIVINDSTHINWYDQRIQSIEASYNSKFWNGTYYTGGSLKDDRANALAIVSGLADSSKYASILENVLIPVQNASPHMEWIVQVAMAEIGATEAAMNRTKERYAPQVNDKEMSTLAEGFGDIGYPPSYNHAWNAPNVLLSKYIAGIQATGVAWSSYEVCPDLVHMSELKTKVPTVKGDVMVDINHNDSLFTLDLISPAACIATIGIPKKRTEIFVVKAGGQTIWENNTFVEGVQGIVFDSEDDCFLKFKVNPGTWAIEAIIKRTPVDFDPELSFESPKAGTSLQEGYENLEVKVNATDDVGIQKVELFLNDTLIGAKTEAPFAWSSSSEPRFLGLPLGGHTFKAVVTDTDGKSVEKQVGINVLKKSEGTVIGTPGSFAQSKGDNTTFDAVGAMFDGDISTFFNTSKENKDNAWGGLYFGENTKKTITKVGFAMRSDNEDNVESHWKKRITGLKFYGANQIDFDGNTIHSVDTAGNLLFVVTPEVAASMKFAEIMEANVTSPNAGGYRYGLVFFKAGSYGNAAEIIFKGDVIMANSIEEIGQTDLALKARFNTSSELFVDYHLKKTANVGITIFDISGRVVNITPRHKEQAGTHRISLRDLKPTKGVYIVSLEIDGVSFTQKVVK